METELNAHLPFLEKVSQFRMTKQCVQLLIDGRAKIHPQVCLTTQTPCPSKSIDTNPGGCLPPTPLCSSTSRSVLPLTPGHKPGAIGILVPVETTAQPWGILLASCYSVSLDLYPTPGLQLSPAAQLPWLLKNSPLYTLQEVQQELTLEIFLKLSLF